MRKTAYGALVVLFGVMLTGLAFAQAKVVVVKENISLKQWSQVGYLTILKVTVKNVGDKDAENVVIGTKCDNCRGAPGRWDPADETKTVKYLAAGDKEEVDVAACLSAFVLPSGVHECKVSATVTWK